MRLLVALAGGAMFALVFALSLAWKKPLANSFLTGAMAALIAGFLLRWWIGLLIRSWQEVKDNPKSQPPLTLDK